MRNFIRVYRGVQDTSGKWEGNPEEQQTGIHWTTDPVVAYHFARHGGMQGESHELNGEGRDPEPSARVLEGWVHKKHIVQPGTNEWHDLSDVDPIFGPKNKEQEITIRPGTQAYVSKIHHIGAQFAHQFGITEFGVPKKVGIYDRKKVEDNPRVAEQDNIDHGPKPEDILDDDTYREIYGYSPPSR